MSKPGLMPDFASALGIPNMPPEHVVLFHQLTGSGHAAFAAKDYGEAVRCYEAAHRQAEVVFGMALESGGAAILIGPMILNVACQNAFAAKSLQGDEDGALDDLGYAAERLTAVAASADASIGMRLSCARHLRWATLALAGTSRRLNADELSKIAAINEEIVRVAKLHLELGSLDADATCH